MESLKSLAVSDISVPITCAPGILLLKKFCSNPFLEP